MGLRNSFLNWVRKLLRRASRQPAEKPGQTEAPIETAGPQTPGTNRQQPGTGAHRAHLNTPAPPSRIPHKSPPAHRKIPYICPLHASFTQTGPASQSPNPPSHALFVTWQVPTLPKHPKPPKSRKPPKSPRTPKSSTLPYHLYTPPSSHTLAPWPRSGSSTARRGRWAIG
jgi:hypothetical protein